MFSSCNSVFFQPKLNSGETTEVLEQEANIISEVVSDLPHVKNNKTFFSPVNSVHGEKRNREIQDSGLKNPPVLTGTINSEGAPLDTETKNFFEPRFGRNFSDVRIHRDSAAERSAQSINAHAYTVGNHIVFNSNRYSPQTRAGKKLLAHELTHVTQQSSLIQPYRDPVSKNTINFGTANDKVLIEESFNMEKDKQTKPWIELITVEFNSKKVDGDNNNFWVGTANVHYYDNPVKLADFRFPISGGSAELGKTDKGNNFTVHRIEGVGYMSSKYSDPFEPVSKTGWGKRYAKDLGGNMNFAIFYNKSEALHSGPPDESSHGCIHVDWADETNMKKLNYHSVIGYTKVTVKYV